MNKTNYGKLKGEMVDRDEMKNYFVGGAVRFPLFSTVKIFSLGD